MRLHLEAFLASPPERIFAAFIDAEQLRHWWGPAGFTIASLQFDVAEGADYRITMQPPRGDVFHIRGTFRVIEAPRRLVYTFIYEERGPDDQETLVTLTFEPADARTHLVLDQGPFKTEARWELHRDGGQKRSSGWSSFSPSTASSRLRWSDEAGARATTV